MSWVNPDYERIVDANGRICYRRRSTVQRSDMAEENEVVRFDGVVVRRDPVNLAPGWIDELIEATQNWMLEALGLLPTALGEVSAEMGHVAAWARGYRADVFEIDGQPVDPRTLRQPGDIVDAIGQLVDEQLAGGPVDDYNADRYDRCPHCDRHWHGLPLTQRVADMYAARQFDEEYRVDTDDTPVICEGSDFTGPMRAPTVSAETLADRIPDAQTWMREHGLPVSHTFIVGGSAREIRWWRYQTPLGRPALAASADIGANFHRYTSGPAMGTWDYLGVRPPSTGHTWEPLTAPGVTDHPDERASAALPRDTDTSAGE